MQIDCFYGSPCSRSVCLLDRLAKPREDDLLSFVWRFADGPTDWLQAAKTSDLLASTTQWVVPAERLLAP